MIKLELDWAADEPAPEPGPEVLEGEFTGIVIVAGQDVGPAGWPTVEVFATDGPALWAWLRNAYCDGDEDQASELAAEAVSV